MVEYINGDILYTNARLIAHGCNAQGYMNKGVAKSIANKWPIVKHEYVKKHKLHGLYLGDVQFVECYDKVVANCITQNNFGNKGQFVDYEALKQCLKKVYNYAEEYNFDIAIPMIGSGYGGGDWSYIKSIIETMFKDINNIYIYYL